MHAPMRLSNSKELSNEQGRIHARAAWLVGALTNDLLRYLRDLVHYREIATEAQSFWMAAQKRDLIELIGTERSNVRTMRGAD
jgi:hypothetical protein